MQVAGDLLVAIEAQLRLAIAIGAVMAQRALLFVFHMSGAELAWHEERFRIHGLSTPPGHESQHQSQYQQKVPSSPLHVVVAVRSSVNVDRNHVNHRGNDHHEDQRYV